MVQSWLLSTTKQTFPDGDSVIVLGTSDDEGGSDQDEDYDNEGQEPLVQDESDDDSDYNDGTQRKPKKQAKTIRRKKVNYPAIFYP